MAAFTTYQHHHSFSCCRNGPHMLFHFISPKYVFQSLQNGEMTCTQNFMIHSHIAIRRGVHLPWIYLYSSISETYFLYWCSRDVWSFGGVHLPWVYLHSSISVTYLMYWCSRDVWSFGRGVHLPLVYLHSSISATYLMYWCSRDVWSFGRGVHLTLVYVHSAFTQHLCHISVIVTVSYCYSSLIVHSQ